MMDVRCLSVRVRSVDDLQRKVGKGAEEMAKSQKMLVFGSDGFFGGSNPPSKPCMLEMFACM